MTKVQRPGLSGSVAAFLVLLAAFAAYSFAVRPWFLQWGAPGKDQTRPLLGDDAWIGGLVSGTRAVTVNAPPERVWPWLVQIGQDRAGFYSYSWLENIVLAGIRNTFEIRPEWQSLKAKDFVRSVKPGYMFGLLKDKEGYTGWRVPFLAPGQAMTLKKWGTFALEPSGEGGTRFLARGRGVPIPGVVGRLIGFWLLDPAHFVMEKKMMTEIKRLAEGRPGPPGWLTLLATAGFAAAAILWETADLRAALVGFTALALVVVGFLAFGKRWWIYFGFFWLYSYTVLFLAADAFIIFGLVFLAASAVLAVTALKGLPSR